MSVKFSTLTEIAPQVIVDAFNQAFAEYFVPIQFTETLLQQKIKQEDLQMDISVGAFVGNQLVGFILHGRRKEQGQSVVYNGGTGVLPTHRGQRLTEKMYAFIMPRLRNEHISSVLLEVISENHRAIKTYKKIGFKIKRVLNCWKSNDNNQLSTLNSEVKLRQIQTPDWSQLRIIGIIRPAWQYNFRSLQNIIETQDIIGAYLQDELVGYTVVNRLSGRIGQIAVAQNWQKKKIGSTIIQYLYQHYPTPLSFINVSTENNIFNPFLLTIGFQLTLQQHEMSLKL